MQGTVSSTIGESERASSTCACTAVVVVPCTRNFSCHAIPLFYSFVTPFSPPEFFPDIFSHFRGIESNPRGPVVAPSKRRPRFAPCLSSLPFGNFDDICPLHRRVSSLGLARLLDDPREFSAGVFSWNYVTLPRTHKRMRRSKCRPRR